MNQEELQRLFAACRKLGIEKAKDLEQFKRKNKCTTNESSEIEPYEGREELTELQEQRQEWLDNTAGTIEETVSSLQEAEDNLDYVEE